MTAIFAKDELDEYRTALAFAEATELELRRNYRKHPEAAINLPKVRAKIREYQYAINRIEDHALSPPASKFVAAGYPGDWMPTLTTTNPEDMYSGYHVTRHQRGEI